MSKRNLFKTILFVVLMSAMLIMSVGAVGAVDDDTEALPTVTQWTKLAYRPDGVKVADFWFQNDFQVLGTSLRCVGASQHVVWYKSGWTWLQGTYPYCNPWYWTQGFSNGGVSGWFREGSLTHKCHVACAIVCDAYYGDLYCEKGCACY